MTSSQFTLVKPGVKPGVSSGMTGGFFSLLGPAVSHWAGWGAVPEEANVAYEDREVVFTVLSEPWGREGQRGCAGETRVLW